MLELRRILCAVDFTDVSARALAYAASTARWYGAGLRVLHVVPSVIEADMFPSLAPDPPSSAATGLKGGAEFRAAAERFVRRAAAQAPDCALVVREDADVADAIIGEAEATRPDLLILGTESRSMVGRLLHRSVAETVMRRVSCPVMIVPAGAARPVPAGDVQFDSVLCALDLSDGSSAPCRYAVSLAEEADATLVLLNVIEVPPEAQVHEEGVTISAVGAAAHAARLGQLRAQVTAESRPFFRLETMVEDGNPSRVILETAAGHASDLIVLGGRHRSAIDRFFFGSTTDAVLQGAQCPVLVVHQAN